MRQLIDESAALGFRLVVFTGGECFLLGRTLDELIARAGRHGLHTRCVTNGYWGTSEHAARARVARLTAAGLGEINFSTGEDHAAWVPVERVVHAARATLEAGIRTVITVETTAEASPVRAAVEAGLAGWCESEQLDIIENVWIEMDGERDLEHPETFDLMSRSEGCKSVVDTISITPYLDVNPCCGLTQDKMDELTLGNLKDGTLTEILESGEDDLLHLWLATLGPEHMLRAAKARNPDLEIPTSSPHPCQSCRFLYSHADVLEEVVACARDREADIVSQFLLTSTFKKMNLDALPPHVPPPKPMLPILQD